MEKVIYFIRHGQSEHNIAPVFQAPDSYLSEVGKKQAESVAERVAKLEFETLISSPWQRAKETALAISKVTGKEPEYSDLFIERVKPTSINGKPYEDKEAHKVWKEWEESLYVSGKRVEDGENFDDLVDRADKALHFLQSRPEKYLVVVTHGFFLRTLIARVLLRDSLTEENHRNFQYGGRMENTGISAIKYSEAKHDKEWSEDARWRLWIYNDHAHLG